MKRFVYLGTNRAFESDNVVLDLGSERFATFAKIDYCSNLNDYINRYAIKEVYSEGCIRAFRIEESIDLCTAILNGYTIYALI